MQELLVGGLSGCGYGAYDIFRGVGCGSGCAWVANHWDGLVEGRRGDVGLSDVEFLGHVADLGLLFLLGSGPDGSG